MFDFFSTLFGEKSCRRWFFELVYKNTENFHTCSSHESKEELPEVVKCAEPYHFRESMKTYENLT